MATTAAPYGLKPVRRMDGMPYAGSTNQYLIDPAGEATNLFYGQVVIIGVFVGCEYVNSSGQLVQAQYYPTGTSNGDAIKAYVIDDPNVLFQAQLDAAGAQTIIGANTFFAAVQSTSTGSTTTGNSTSALDATVKTAAAAFRVVSHVSPASDAFPDVLVKFNPSAHSLMNNVGL